MKSIDACATGWALAAGEWPGEYVPKGAAARPVVAAGRERERERERGNGEYVSHR